MQEDFNIGIVLNDLNQPFEFWNWRFECKTWEDLCFIEHLSIFGFFLKMSLFNLQSVNKKKSQAKNFIEWVKLEFPDLDSQ